MDLLRTRNRHRVRKTVLRAPGRRLDYKFGPYRILRPLGKGGMGTVYLVASDLPAGDNSTKFPLQKGSRECRFIAF